jgi:two-component system, OmpR family, response regulator
LPPACAPRFGAAQGGPARFLKRTASSFDTRSWSGDLGGVPVDLTAQEVAVLSYLIHNAGRLISRTELSEHIYEYDADRDSNTIAVFINRLRNKLGADLIQTVRGRGYMIEQA